MAIVLRGLTRKTCLIYLDDMMVMGKTFEEHFTNLEEIFKSNEGGKLDAESEEMSPFPKRSRIPGVYYFSKRDQN